MGRGLLHEILRRMRSEDLWYIWNTLSCNNKDERQELSSVMSFVSLRVSLPPSVCGILCVSVGLVTLWLLRVLVPG